MTTLREDSVKQWTGTQTFESINCGSLQRIADAAEKMAIRHTELIRERDMYERWYKERGNRMDTLRRQLAAAKGQITKLKKQMDSQ